MNIGETYLTILTFWREIVRVQCLLLPFLLFFCFYLSPYPCPITPALYHICLSYLFTPWLMSSSSLSHFLYNPHFLYTDPLIRKVSQCATFLPFDCQIPLYKTLHGRF